MRDALRTCLQIAGGLTEVTRQRAASAARELLDQAGIDLDEVQRKVAGRIPPEVQTLADELVTAGRTNRDLLVGLIREEVDKAMQRAGRIGDELVRVGVLVEMLERRIRNLEGGGEPGPAAPEAPAGAGAGGGTETVRAVKGISRTTGAREAAALRLPAEEATKGTPTSPREAAAHDPEANGRTPAAAAVGTEKKTPAAKTPATKTPAAKRTPAKKTPAKKAPAKKVSAKNAGGGGGAVKRAAAARAATASASASTTVRKAASRNTRAAGAEEPAPVRGTDAVETAGPAVKKAAGKKAVAGKAAAKKTAAEKAPARKTAAKKVAAKKTAAKKTVVVKGTAEDKAAIKKTTARRAAARRTSAERAAEGPEPAGGGAGRADSAERPGSGTDA
ncbi:hypothetical protein GCM10010406_39340 [Streptomyces thermolineatus]|uniref:Histone n=1 Tax=Streptomyces thermolineatus TaxID=44033 RepID=A0ABN3MAY5_9ACTN